MTFSISLPRWLRQPQPDISNQGIVELGELFHDAIQSGTVPGAVAIVTGPKKVLYHEAFGFQNRELQKPMKRDSIFRIASMTKPITSVATMMLYERGECELDDPVAKHLRAYRQPQVLVSVEPLELRPARTPVTIRHLLNHTSGYGYRFSNQLLADYCLKTGNIGRSLPLVHDPGERWTYGSGAAVLGDIIARKSTNPLDEFLNANIFRPLGMNDTSYRVAPNALERLVTLNCRRPGGLYENQNTNFEDGPVVGDQGLCSTALDYAKFLQLFLNEGRANRTRLLDRSSIRMMTSNQIGGGFITVQPSTMQELTQNFPIGGDVDKFGLGFQIKGRREPRWRSVGSYKMAGIYNTHFWVDPKWKIAAVLLMQILPFYDDGCIDLLTGFQKLVYSHVVLSGANSTTES